MSWYTTSSDTKIPQGVEAKVKTILKKHQFFQNLLLSYHIPVEDIDNNLTIQIQDLKDKFAESDGEQIILSKKLFQHGEKFFFEHNFHFVAHEFFHWIKRRAEKRFYFNDLEEIDSFTLNIAWLLMSGYTPEMARKRIYPIVEGHFQDKSRAKELYITMEQDALRLVETYNA